MPLDAFARCWVQEFALFDAIAGSLPAARRPLFARLAQAWRDRRWQQFDEAMAALADAGGRRAGRARAARRRADAAPPGRGDRRRAHRTATRRGSARSTRSRARSTTTCARSLDRLLAIHGLEGRAGPEVDARVASDVVTEGRIDEGKAAAVGGIVSGAMTGLAADLAAGGLTFGAGMLTGAVLGALGGAGLARGVNVARGTTEDAVRWDDAFLRGLLVNALLRYLAVAHYGRGRGDWQASEYPPFWRAARRGDRRRAGAGGRRAARAARAGRRRRRAGAGARVPGRGGARAAGRSLSGGVRRRDARRRRGQRATARRRDDAQVARKTTVAFRLRISKGEDIAVGPGKIDLLEAIAATGSITAAAKQLGMSYRRAWLLVDTMNRSFQGAGRRRGGRRQRAAAAPSLTALGAEVVLRYRRIEQAAARAGAADLQAFLALLAR